MPGKYKIVMLRNGVLRITKTKPDGATVVIEGIGRRRAKTLLMETARLDDDGQTWVAPEVWDIEGAFESDVHRAMEDYKRKVELEYEKITKGSVR